MKRDLINEIKALKERSLNLGYSAYHHRLNEVYNSFQEIFVAKDVESTEFLKYVPITLVALFEAFFREVIRALIDSGSPYSENAINFNQSKNVKFDFDIVNAIQAKSVTMGDFISHILPYNNFIDINSNLSTILGCDFLNSLKNFTGDIYIDQTATKARGFNLDYAQVLDDINRVYEIRHILCHEFGGHIQLNKKETFRYFENSSFFLSHVDNFIFEILYPNSPKTQHEANEVAWEQYHLLNDKLNQLIKEIIEKEGIESQATFSHEMFTNSIKKWQEYREAHARTSALKFKGGSIYPMIYANSLISLTQEKIRGLQAEYEITKDPTS